MIALCSGQTLLSQDLVTDLVTAAGEVDRLGVQRLLVAVEVLVVPRLDFLNVVQKLLLCVLLLYVLRRWGHWVDGKLRIVTDLLAELSFGIYLIHFAILLAYVKVAGPYLGGPDSFWLRGHYVTVLSLLVGTVAVCFAALLSARRLLGRRSRLILGT